jgi:hypothetical protein
MAIYTFIARAITVASWIIETRAKSVLYSILITFSEQEWVAVIIF